MRRARRPFIPQRRRIFFGCEGESEQGYGALLTRLIENRRRDIHLDIVLLKPGGGDPLALIELALRRIGEGERKRESPYVHRAILIDTDRLGQTPTRDAQIARLAASAKLRIIWQEPCHEAFVLRHLDGCQNLRPPTSDLSMQELRRQWPEFIKGMPAARLTDLSAISGSETRQIPIEVRPTNRKVAFSIENHAGIPLFAQQSLQHGILPFDEVKPADRLGGILARLLFDRGDQFGAGFPPGVLVETSPKTGAAISARSGYHEGRAPAVSAFPQLSSLVPDSRVQSGGVADHLV